MNFFKLFSVLAQHLCRAKSRKFFLNVVAYASSCAAPAAQPFVVAKATKASSVR